MFERKVSSHQYQRHFSILQPVELFAGRAGALPPPARCWKPITEASQTYNTNVNGGAYVPVHDDTAMAAESQLATSGDSPPSRRGKMR